MESHISHAHEFVQTFPLSDKTVKCASCGIEAKIGEWNVERCTPHHVGENSGWDNDGLQH